MREATHGSSDGERRKGGTLSTTDSNDAWRCRGPDQVRGAKRPGDAEGLGDHGEVQATSGRGGAREPEDWDDAGVSKDHGGAWGMEEPDGAVGWSLDEAQQTAPEVSGDGWATTDQGVASGTREPGEVKGTTVPGGPQGVNIQYGAYWSMSRGGTKGSKGWGGAWDNDGGDKEHSVMGGVVATKNTLSWTGLVSTTN